MTNENPDPTALLPCPFCGSPARLRDDKWNAAYEVECNNPDCGPIRKTEAEAIEHWNRRAACPN
jgi:Lar family restriction alleviation protein